MFRLIAKLITGILLSAIFIRVAQALPQCGDKGIALQILGSGGPEINDQRASTGYLVWQDGLARILIDIGPGSLLRYESSGARLEDLDVILLTHLHVDHSADLPALVKGSFFTGRDRNLPVYGPTGNALMPSTRDFIDTMFASPDGAFHYLDDFLSGDAGYRLIPHDIETDGAEPVTVVNDERFRLSAIPVHHGPIPALAWRIDIGGKRIVISGDMNGDMHTLGKLAYHADLLVAHHAIPEGTQGVARNLHMPPSVIGTIAAKTNVEQLVLSHRMLRTIGLEKESSRLIRKRYHGAMVFAEDGQCLDVQ
jgi:ribonuclease BN (tRNA processing enzyme)